MGAPRREPGRRANEAEKLIQLQRPFYFALTETSNKEYRQWKSEHNSSSIRGLSLDLNDQPVSNIAWQDAALFCNWLSEKENLPKFYNVVDDRVTSINWDSNGYRLPTESEWSWVAKVTKLDQQKFSLGIVLHILRPLCQATMLMKVQNQCYRSLLVTIMTHFPSLQALGVFNLMKKESLT